MSITLEEGFLEMYDEYFPYVYNYLFYRVKHRQTAEDLTSDVFMKIFEHRGEFKSEKSSLKTWIFTIAKNTLTDFYRKNSRIKENNVSIILANEFNIEYEYIKKDEQKTVLNCLFSMNEQDRCLIYLKHCMDFSYREIALHMDMKEKQVSVALFRAMRRLKKRLSKEGIYE